MTAGILANGDSIIGEYIAGRMRSSFVREAAINNRFTGSFVYFLLEKLDIKAG